MLLLLPVLGLLNIIPVLAVVTATQDDGREPHPSPASLETLADLELPHLGGTVENARRVIENTTLPIAVNALLWQLQERDNGRSHLDNQTLLMAEAVFNRVSGLLISYIGSTQGLRSEIVPRFVVQLLSQPFNRDRFRSIFLMDSGPDPSLLQSDARLQLGGIELLTDDISRVRMLGPMSRTLDDMDRFKDLLGSHVISIPNTSVVDNMMAQLPPPGQTRLRNQLLDLIDGWLASELTAELSAVLKVLQDKFNETPPTQTLLRGFLNRLHDRIQPLFLRAEQTDNRVIPALPQSAELTFLLCMRHWILARDPTRTGVSSSTDTYNSLGGFLTRLGLPPDAINAYNTRRPAATFVIPEAKLVVELDFKFLVIGHLFDYPTRLREKYQRFDTPGISKELRRQGGWKAIAIGVAQRSHIYPDVNIDDEFQKNLPRLRLADPYFTWFKERILPEFNHVLIPLAATSEMEGYVVSWRMYTPPQIPS